MLLRLYIIIIRLNDGGVGMNTDEHVIAWNEQVKLARQSGDAYHKVQNVMVPALTDAELDEYVRERSGEVVSYKIAGVQR